MLLICQQVTRFFCTFYNEAAAHLLVKGPFASEHQALKAFSHPLKDYTT